MKNRICMIVIVTLVAAQVAWAQPLASPPLSPADSRAAKKDKPIKVFVLVGDENMLEQGAISGAKPGTLETIVARNPKYAFLKSKDGKWVTRNDVVLYDLHPLLNNTVSMGHYLQVGDVPYGGRPARQRMGVELMFGTVMGEHFHEPVLLVRYANNRTMSASLGRNYLPPSSGGAGKITGGWDVIHFNWGVWDAMYHDKSSKYYQGHGNTTAVADYERNVRTLVARLKQTGATLIFANTTPVWEGEPGRPNGDVEALNRVARKVMEEKGVIYEDLNAEVRRQGQGKSHNVHDVGNLAPLVTKDILEALAARKQNAKPIPRVLLIGDSITGSYRNGVMKALDGKAEFYMQPGNAESTWTGLRRIDEWLDLKRYVRSGDDYMNLVDGLRSALKNLDRVYPDYAGQGAELAGLVWFQGLADATSTSMTAAYQTNLVNLIKDLRKDLDAPRLPMVVAALCPSPKGLRNVAPPNLKKIFTAQLAVGNPKQYPEFAGNVISLDTSSDLQPPELCPESLPSPTTFGGNAESYLKLGEQTASALLQLMKPSTRALSPTQANVAYGEHERQVLDSRADAGRFIDAHVHFQDCHHGDLDKVAEWMRANHVRRCINHPLKQSRAKNDAERRQMLENYVKYRGRIDRFCIIYPEEVNSVEEAVKLLTREKQDGAVGFGEHYGVDLKFDDPKNMRLYSACAKVGLPVMFHMDRNKNLDEKGLPRLENVLKTHPKCILIAHSDWWRNLGDGTCDRLLQKYPNLYADISCTVGRSAIGRDKKFAREFLIRNADKLLFGTDSGWWSLGIGKKPAPEFSLIDELDLPAEVVDKICRGNAERLFWHGKSKDSSAPGARSADASDKKQRLAAGRG